MARRPLAHRSERRSLVAPVHPIDDVGRCTRGLGREPETAGRGYIRALKALNVPTALADISGLPTIAPRTTVSVFDARIPTT